MMHNNNLFLSSYTLFDVEVMSKDLKIYMLKPEKCIYDVKQLDSFIKIIDIILDTENIDSKFIGDYFTGFDLPLLSLVRDFYYKHKNNFSESELIIMIIDFAFDKTQKLIKYGCSDTIAQFESLKNRFLFCQKYIDVKFLISTKIHNTGLKHFQGAILNDIQDFDFDTKVYDVEQLDKYGLNDVVSSQSRFEHPEVQLLLKQLILLSKKLDLYVVNFVPAQIILYLYTKVLGVQYVKCAIKKNSRTLESFDFDYNDNYKILLNDLLSKLGESFYKQRKNFKYSNYTIRVEQFLFSIVNNVFKSKQLDECIKINLFESILSLLSINFNHSISGVINIILMQFIHNDYDISSKLLRSIYVVINSSVDYNVVDKMILFLFNKILTLIDNLNNNNIVIYGLVRGTLYLSNTADKDILLDILNKFNDQVKYFFHLSNVYIFDFNSVISDDGLQTGIFDIKYRTFEKSINMPSIYSVKTAINKLLKYEKYKITIYDYIFIVGQCSIGLTSLNSRANMIVYGNETIILEKENYMNKLKLQYQKYSNKITIDSIKHFYVNEYSLHFKHLY